MPKRMKVERSPNYSYYSDILWCSLPLVGMSCLVFTVCARCCFFWRRC